MKLDIKPGKYVVAVSGGVDSMVLLDLLSKNHKLDLVVAHFDHGIRKDSAKDADFVKQTAKKHRLTFELGHGKLGKNASEATARESRYGFLEKVQLQHGADAIITAHHQDDLIETALLNLLRGSGWRGLVAISRNPNVRRPLLGYNKKQILAYAKKNHQEWREDSTNSQTEFLRNRLRQEILPKLSQIQRNQLLKIINEVDKNASPLEEGLAKLGAQQGNQLDRKAFANLPAAIANELLMVWLRNNKIADVDRATINRLSNAIKAARPGSNHDVKSGVGLRLSDTTASLESAKRSD